MEKLPAYFLASLILLVLGVWGTPAEAELISCRTKSPMEFMVKPLDGQGPFAWEDIFVRIEVVFVKAEIMNQPGAMRCYYRLKGQKTGYWWTPKTSNSKCVPANGFTVTSVKAICTKGHRACKAECAP